MTTIFQIFEVLYAPGQSDKQPLDLSLRGPGCSLFVFSEAPQRWKAKRGVPWANVGILGDSTATKQEANLTNKELSYTV